MKTTVVTKAEDGSELVLAVLSPSGKVKGDATVHKLAAYNQAVASGVMIRQQLEQHLRRMNLWDDEREAEFQRLRKAVLAGELALKKGGIRKAKAREVAIQMVRDRAEIGRLRSASNEVAVNTADALAEQAAFNFLVASCTVHGDGPREGLPYFTRDGVKASVDAYVEQGTSEAANAAAAAVNELLYGKAEAGEDVPEMAFLKKYGFVDAEGRFVDADGNFVNADGNRVDADGYLVNGDGQRVDDEGNPIDENGEYIVEFEEFID